MENNNIKKIIPCFDELYIDCGSDGLRSVMAFAAIEVNSHIEIFPMAIGDEGMTILRANPDTKHTFTGDSTFRLTKPLEQNSIESTERGEI